MQALPAVQSIPQQTQDTQPSSATNGGGTDFKTMLQSSSTNASKKTDPNDQKASSGKTDSPEKSAVQPPAIPVMAVLDVNHPEKVDLKGAQKKDPKKEAKSDPAVPPPVSMPAEIPMQGVAAQKPAVKAEVADAAGKSRSIGDTLKNAPIQPDAKPATIAQTGNNLPPKEIKASFSQTMAEKTVLPETRKTSENQITLQPAAIPQNGTAKSIPKLTVNAPVSSPQWGSELGQKIAWMTSSGDHVAELHLNPPNLGPLEVKLTLNNDQATIQFVSQHQEVRTALESALPKLREMMMDSGISLGNASVDSGSFQQSGFDQQERPRQSFMAGTSLQQQTISPIRVSRLMGKVDTFV